MNHEATLTPEEQEQLDRKTVDLAERRKMDRANAEYRRKARMQYEQQAGIAATKEKAYKVAKSVRYLQLRHAGETGEASRIQAEGDENVSTLREERDVAASLAKAALLRVDEAESERVSIRDLHKTSERIDGLGA